MRCTMALRGRRKAQRRRPRRAIVRLLRQSLIVILAIVPGVAAAQQVVIEDPLALQHPEAWTEHIDHEPEQAPGLLGSALHGRNGLTAEYIYTGEVFNNMRGGENTRNATEYRGNFDLVLTADLDRMGFFPGGTFFIYGQNGHGKGLTEGHVCDCQTYSNIDAPDFVQVSEYWWERSLWDGLITVRLGKQDANTDFAVVDLGGDFINSSFGFTPTIPMVTFPDPSAGAVTFFQLREWLTFKVGVWDGAPDGGNWGFSGTGDVFSIYEFKAEWGLLGRRLPGDFHVGMWHHSGEVEELGDPGVTHDGTHGLHMGFDQRLFKENWDESDDQGLGLFLQYGWAPKETNQHPSYFGAGLVYLGLIPSRDDDLIGLGVAHAIYSDDIPSQTYETEIELFYKAPLTPYFTIQPDVQFIANPDGDGRDAFVAGMRFEVIL